MHLTKRMMGYALAGMLLGGAAATARTGAGSSGGGLLLKDSLNPWFLQNTPEIRYCIAEDASRFSLDRTRAEQQIEAAYAYWQDEFKKAPAFHWANLTAPNDQFLLATQRLVPSDCGPDTDLVFQLGAATPDQQAAIEDFANTVAATVRTSYDHVNLRGKGFIFVAPDSGPVMTSGARRVGDGYWGLSGGALFKLTMIHELGHVFGMPDSGFSSSPMSYDFVEYLVSFDPEITSLLAQLPPPEVVRITHNWLSGAVCTEHQAVTDRDQWIERVLGVPAHTGWGCQSVNYQDDTLKISAGPDEQHLRLVGQATLAEEAREGQSLVTVYLPPEQQIYQYRFPNDTQNFHRFTAVAEQVVQLTGTYENLATHLRTPITFTLRPGDYDLRIAAAVDGRLVTDLLQGQVFSRSLKDRRN